MDRTEPVTVNDAAKMIGITARGVRDLINSGQLEATDVSLKPGQGNPRWRIETAEITDFKMRRQNKPVTPTTPKRSAVPQPASRYF